MTPRGNLAYSDPKLSFSEEVSHEMRFLKDSRSTKARFFDFRKRAGCGAAVSCSDHARIMVKSSVYWRKALRDFLIKSWLWFLEEMSQSCGVFKSLLFAAYIFSWQAQCFVRMSCGLLCLRLCHCDLRFTVCLHPRVDFVASAELWECFLCLVFFWKTVIFRCHCCECGFL